MQVINFYIALLQEQDTHREDPGHRKSHFFNSFFYAKLSEGGYNYVNVRRWTRKFDIFNLDKVFVPVNLANVSTFSSEIFFRLMLHN